MADLSPETSVNFHWRKGATSQKTAIFIDTAVKISNLAYLLHYKE
jgi:hypothetical protein